MSRLSRREFLVLTGVVALATLPGCGGDCDSASASPTTRVAYRLSGRGRRISQAAKRHNANKLFASADLARRHRAHPGDTSEVVSVQVSPAFHQLVFADGDIADLRRVL